MKQSLVWLISVSVFLVFATVFAHKLHADVPPELDRYMAMEDDSFQWKITESDTESPVKTWLVELTSQTWHGIAWKHCVFIVEPKKLTHPDKALLFIDGGSIGKTLGENDRKMFSMLAENIGAYLVCVRQIPNQPLFGDYVEDALIGETFLNAIAENDATWPALFPMAKSAIRAMDAAQEIIKQERDNTVKQFVVTGASKRGWTTWLAAATGDPRIIAIAPIVIDNLNIGKQMEYQVETWGTWSPSIHDYTSRNLVDHDPEKLDDFTKRLWRMVDPYWYLERLSLPKLLIHGTNDPYWTVDATSRYWDDLPGVKFLVTFPNVGHNLGDEKLRAFMTLAAFARYAFQGYADWPSATWKQDQSPSGDYVLTVKTDLPSGTALLWTAHSENKDFRQATWESTEIKPTAYSGTIRTTVEKPKSGHVAFYVEIESEFDGLPFSVTTQVFRK